MESQGRRTGIEWAWTRRLLGVERGGKPIIESRKEEKGGEEEREENFGKTLLCVS
jgi:hypothetical protein